MTEIKIACPRSILRSFPVQTFAPVFVAPRERAGEYLAPFVNNYRATNALFDDDDDDRIDRARGSIVIFPRWAGRGEEIERIASRELSSHLRSRAIAIR